MIVIKGFKGMSEKDSIIHPGSYTKQNIIPEGLSVTKAAERMGMGRPALSNFLNGKASLSMKMATRLEKTFDADKSKLLAMQQEYDRYCNKEEEKHIAVKSFTPSFLQITATQIDAWADKIETRSLLPVLIRRLVNTTNRSITASNFPAYDESQKKGWDGTVEAETATPWVPIGKSGWEFGCNKEPGAKANKDYNNRTKPSVTPTSVQKQTKFVFVTPRKWPGKDSWLKKKKAEQKWKDILAFDAGDLEQWIELSISTQVWLAEQLGIPTNDCQTLDEYWSNWSKTADPAISPKIFDSAITDHLKTVTDWLNEPPKKPLVITGASKEEAIAFLCCVTSHPELSTIAEQAVLVSSEEAIKKLSNISSQFIPVAYTDEAQHPLIPLIDKRHTIIVSERNIKGIEPDISLDLPNFEAFQKALTEMGFDDAEIETYSNSTSHSPTILRRRLARIPASTKPAWADLPNQIKSMIPLVLAGSWDTNKEADKEILCLLARVDNYQDIKSGITELLHIDDSPIWNEGSHYGVISNLDCFYTIADHLTAEIINDFFDAAMHVLSEDDPALDLDKEDRWAANIYHKVRDHSSAIRNNLCENLTLMAVHGNALFGQQLNIDIEYKVSNLIKKLLYEKDERTWLAQQNMLPKYAEAAPEKFLAILEEELKKKQPALQALFTPVDSGPFANCDRTGVLWALELLAWNPDNLARVATILAKLSRYELNDNWINKPYNSLKDILLYWKPHTASSLEERCEVLELICKDYPDIGWKLCVQSVKSRHDMTSGTYKPRWRSDASGAKNTVTIAEANTYRLKCLELVLSYQDHTSATLKDLIDCLTSMPQSDKDKAITHIKTWFDAGPPDDEVIALREHVRTTTMTSRALRRQKNSENDNSYTGGKELYALLEPKDVLLKHKWLFLRSWVEYTPEELEEDFDHKTRQKGLEKQRITALSEIKEDKGINGILDLIKNTDAAQHIGHHLYKDILSESNRKSFIKLCLIDSHEKIDQCLGGFLHQMPIDDWIAILEEIDNEIQNNNYTCRLLQAAPFNSETWALLEKYDSDIKTQYWKNVQASYCNQKDVNYAVSKLLEAGRSATAYHIAHLDLEHIDSQTIIDLLRLIAKQDPSIEPQIRPQQYDIEKAFELLSKRDDIDSPKLASLEFAYAEVFDRHSGYAIPNISKLVSESPLFFVQLIAYIYKPLDGHEDPEDWAIPNDDEHRRNAATKASHILENISIIPGSQKDGSINIGLLRDWIEQARSIANQYGRGDKIDRKIGNLLSASGTDDDGLWPRKEVREVIDEIASEDMATNMIIGRFNSCQLRPTNNLSSEEQSKAARYREMASKIKNKTPFVAKMLRELADMYHRNAEWSDEHDRISRRLHRY